MLNIYLLSSLGTVSWIFSYSLLVFVVGKFWNVDKFGEFNLIIAFAYGYSLIFTLGIDTALTHYISRLSENTRQNFGFFPTLIKIYRQRWWIIALLLPTSLLFGFITSVQVAGLSLLLGMTYAFRSLADAWLRGRQKFQTQMKMRLAESGVVGLGIAACIMFPNTNIAVPIGFLGGSYLLFTGLVSWLSIRQIKQMNIPDTRNITDYAKWAGLGGIGGLVTAYADKPLVKIVAGEAGVGLYSAYSFWAVSAVNGFLALFLNVFFPVSSGIADKNGFRLKLNRLSLILFVPLLILITLLIYAGLVLFGRNYIFRPDLAILWAGYSVIFLYWSVLNWIVNSDGERGMKFTSRISIISYLVIIFLLLILRKYITLQTIIAANGLGLLLNSIGVNIFYIFKKPSSYKDISPELKT